MIKVTRSLTAPDTGSGGGVKPPPVRQTAGSRMRGQLTPQMFKFWSFLQWKSVSNVCNVWLIVPRPPTGALPLGPGAHWRNSVSQTPWLKPSYENSWCRYWRGSLLGLPTVPYFLGRHVLWLHCPASRPMPSRDAKRPVFRPWTKMVLK